MPSETTTSATARKSAVKFDLVLLTIAGIITYGRVIGFEILANWDDPQYITTNQIIRGFSLEHLQLMFTSSVMGNYAPVQLLSYMADYIIGGSRINPAVFHASNLFFHIANALLFYWFVNRSTRSREWAVAAAALFLLHPVQVESVAWLSQRKNLLSLFFFLITLLSYERYRHGNDSTRQRYYLIAVFTALCALFAKVSVVIIPLVLILFDQTVVAPEKRPSWKKVLIDSSPFFVMAGLMAYQSSMLQMQELGGGRAGYHGGSLAATMLTMLHVLVDYLRLIFWPTRLNALYTPDIVSHADAATTFIFITLILAIAGCCLLFKKNRPLSFGPVLFFLGLLPVSQLIPLVTLMHDRYLYVPMLGVAWLAGGLVHFQLQHRPSRRPALAGAGALLLILLGALSFQRAAVWRNSVTLWSDAAKKLPDNWGVWDALAEAYVSAGDNEGAVRAYDKVFSMNPDFLNEERKECKAYNNAAVLFIDRRELQRAKQLLDHLTGKFPEYLPGFINRGYLARLEKDWKTAETAAQHVLERDPRNSSALLSLGIIARENGELANARRYCNAALANGGDGAELQYALATLDAREGNHAGALEHLESAARQGFNDIREILHNRDFDPIRSDGRFHMVINTLSTRQNKRSSQ
jgi:tetratricopeptide (TPR) repeat protein